MNRLSSAMVSLVATVATILGPMAVGEAAAETVRFALVIGNNQPESANQAVLRYADDDAFSTAALFEEAKTQVTLLARADVDSVRQHSRKADGLPTKAELKTAVTDLRALVAKAKTAGHETELFVFYSGHGDVENGEGYVVLEGARLTRSELYRDLLAPIAADQNHVIIDACKSYFLAFEKGPRTRRTKYRGAFVSKPDDSLRANTGFVLSTSSDAESHEWERFGAGVFSHEVRSALRGGADLDANGEITYAELGAFLDTANGAIVNARFRPDFAVRAPGKGTAGIDEVVLGWPVETADLILDRPESGHLYIEDSSGVRLLDVNATTDVVLSIHLPSERPLFVRTRQGETAIAAADGVTRHSETREAEPRIASKGALHVALEALFTRPHGPRALEAFREAYQPDAQRLVAPARLAPRIELGSPPSESSRDTVRTAVGASALALTAIGGSIHVATLLRRRGLEGASHQDIQERNRQLRVMNWTALSFYGLGALAAGTWLTLRLTGSQKSGVDLAVAPSSSGGAVVIGGRF